MLQQQLQQASQQKESLQEEVNLAHSVIKEEDRYREQLLTTLDGMERELRQLRQRLNRLEKDKKEQNLPASDCHKNDGEHFLPSWSTPTHDLSSTPKR